MKPKRLSVVGELHRLARQLKRQSKEQHAMYQAELEAGRYGEYAKMLSGRSIGLEWAAKRVATRARELARPSTGSDDGGKR